MSKTNKPRQVAAYRLEVIGDEVLLFHPTTTQIIYCNPSASLIWQLCDGQRTVDEIVALLAAAYPEAAESMAADVDAALQQLHEHGAVEFV